jgi:hypothetical protein
MIRAPHGVLRLWKGSLKRRTGRRDWRPSDDCSMWPGGTLDRPAA